MKKEIKEQIGIEELIGGPIYNEEEIVNEELKTEIIVDEIVNEEEIQDEIVNEEEIQDEIVNEEEIQDEIVNEEEIQDEVTSTKVEKLLGKIDNCVKANVRKEPDIKSTVIIALEKDTIVEIIEEIGEWCHIIQNNIEGYTMKNYIKLED